jgi:hypothetical protein
MMDMFTKKTYELPISPTYVRHWGLVEAVRELIQNAIDSESPFEYEFTEQGDLHIISRYATLSPTTLLLGSTSKAERTDAIGSFGEGYKIALLVLARENRAVTIYNGDRVWRPMFKFSKTYDADVLCIEDTISPRRNEGLRFVIEKLSPSEIDAIIESCLMMQKHIGQIAQAVSGTILLEKPGKLYIGGLYICDTKMKYGYNLNPGTVALERDRKTVDGFNLGWWTKELWFQTERWEEIASLIEAEVPDMEYAEYGAPEILKETLYRIFTKKHPGKIIAKNRADLEEKVKSGLIETQIVTMGGPYATLVSSSHSYRTSQPVKEPAALPYVQLERWLKANRSEMRSKAIEAFKDLIKTAKDWEP